MRMRRKTGARRDPVLIDHAQRPEIFERRIVIIRKGETVFGVQPVDFGCSAFGRFADRDHLRTLASTASHTSLAMSAPPKRLTSWMPVGEVTLISVMYSPITSIPVKIT